MNAVMGALARGEITPGEAERIAAVVDTFAGAIETSNQIGSHLNIRPILTADGGDDQEDPGEGADRRRCRFTRRRPRPYAGVG
jgi:hypothetical protein